MILVLEAAGQKFVDHGLCEHCRISKMSLFTHPDRACDHPDCGK